VSFFRFKLRRGSVQLIDYGNGTIILFEDCTSSDGRLGVMESSTPTLPYTQTPTRVGLRAVPALCSLRLNHPGLKALLIAYRDRWGQGGGEAVRDEILASVADLAFQSDDASRAFGEFL